MLNVHVCLSVYGHISPSRTYGFSCVLELDLSPQGTFLIPRPLDEALWPVLRAHFAAEAGYGQEVSPSPCGPRWASSQAAVQSGVQL